MRDAQPSRAAFVPWVAAELQEAWLADPRCIWCGDAVAAVGEAALLVGPRRVAHRAGCFIPALLRLTPLLGQLSAERRAVRRGSDPDRA